MSDWQEAKAYLWKMTLVIAVFAIYVFGIAGCAPTPEWSGKPDEMMMPTQQTWHRMECTREAPPVVELRCLGDEPPELAKAYTTCGDDPRVCAWRDVSVWRCPVVVADREFNR